MCRSVWPKPTPLTNRKSSSECSQLHFSGKPQLPQWCLSPGKADRVTREGCSRREGQLTQECPSHWKHGLHCPALGVGWGLTSAGTTWATVRLKSRAGAAVRRLLRHPGARQGGSGQRRVVQDAVGPPERCAVRSEGRSTVSGMEKAPSLHPSSGGHRTGALHWPLLCPPEAESQGHSQSPTPAGPSTGT